jgi:hypothetical protein
MTVWSLLEECVGQLDEPFRRSEIVGWFRRHYPEVNEATLGAHIQAATANATHRAQNNALGTRPALLRRIDHGLYVQAGKPETPAAQLPRMETSAPGGNQPIEADVVLVGCVRTKGSAACAAAELFISPLFERRRQYAMESGLPWYILSAKFGLLAPDDVIGPYDVYLADQSPGYKKAWGEFVTAQLEQRLPSLRHRAIEVHAGAAYVDPIRAPLAAGGARLAAPLAHLRQGEQVGWYTPTGTAGRAPVTPRGPVADAAPPPEKIERSFHRAMVAIYETAKRELGYNATRFLQMVSEQGGLATAGQLLWSDKPSDGFTTLWSHHRLDLTVEALVLREEYAALFTEVDRQRARDRLELYGWSHDRPQ